MGNKWFELEKSLTNEPTSPQGSQGRHDQLVEQVLLEAGVMSTFLNTLDLLNMSGGRHIPHVAVLEALGGVMSALQQLHASFCTVIMPEGLNNFLNEEPWCFTSIPGRESGCNDFLRRPVDEAS